MCLEKNFMKKKIKKYFLFSGVEKLLTHLHKYRVPLALATNSSERILRLHMMMRPKLFCLFHHNVSDTD